MSFLGQYFFSGIELIASRLVFGNAKKTVKKILFFVSMTMDMQTMSTSRHTS
jgi:hypothetical protein